jgi:PadR family transcriptional regulator
MHPMEQVAVRWVMESPYAAITTNYVLLQDARTNGGGHVVSPAAQFLRTRPPPCRTARHPTTPRGPAFGGQARTCTSKLEVPRPDRPIATQPVVPQAASSPSGLSAETSLTLLLITLARILLVTGKEALGEFEHQVLLAALRLGNEAYSAEIVIELEQRIERQVAPAAVYIALRRLEENGFVESMKRVSDGRGGSRERRWFVVTPDGLRILRRARERFIRLWEGLEPTLAEP